MLGAALIILIKNFQIFQNWITRFIDYPNRWKIILVCNSIINKNISWAFKFFPVPDHLIENWDEYGISLLDKLSQQAKKNNLIFFISAGPAANIIISNLIRINKYNIYSKEQFYFSIEKCYIFNYFNYFI